MSRPRFQTERIRSATDIRLAYVESGAEGNGNAPKESCNPRMIKFELTSTSWIFFKGSIPSSAKP